MLAAGLADVVGGGGPADRPELGHAGEQVQGTDVGNRFDEGHKETL